MGVENAESLIRKYLAGTATPEEEALLESWYNAAVESQPEMPGEPDYPKIGEEILGALRAEQKDHSQPSLRSAKSVISIWRRVAAVAAVLLIVTVGGLLLIHKDTTNTRPTIQGEGLLAGAVLTLSDGQKVSLANIAVGGTITDGNLHIVKLDSVSIGYDHQPGNNTLSTARGQQYRVVLPDGSQVWLNSLATLTFPGAFTDTDRIVQLIGEAWFEIQPNASTPFKVSAPGMDVQVLGTRFDVMAYPDEQSVRATLVDGSIAVSRGERRTVLQPGEQAQASPAGFGIVKADLEQVLAWRRGEFRFKKESIQPIMRQVARWYDVTIDYSGPISQAPFTGVITRKETVAQLLEGLEISGDVHFVVSGKKITVMPGPR